MATSRCCRETAAPARPGPAASRHRPGRQPLLARSRCPTLPDRACQIRLPVDGPCLHGCGRRLVGARADPTSAPPLWGSTVLGARATGSREPGGELWVWPDPRRRPPPCTHRIETEVGYRGRTDGEEEALLRSRSGIGWRRPRRRLPWELHGLPGGSL